METSLCTPRHSIHHRRLGAGARVVVPLMLSLGACLLWLCVQAEGKSGGGPVYTVAQIQDYQADDPRAWASRRVLVRAIAGGCIPWAAPPDSPCVDELPALVDTAGAGHLAVLPLVCRPGPPLLGFLRHLPFSWLGQLLPAPQVLRPGARGVYHVQLPSVPGYEALLLDTTSQC